jgi:hypothetical protein
MTISTTAPITAADKAWAEKMARLEARQLPKRVVTLVDDALVDAAEEAQVALGLAEAQARVELDEKHSDKKDKVERRAMVEKALPRHRLVRERTQAYEAAEQARIDAEIKIPMQGLPPYVYESLQAQHPATEAQRKNGMAYNVDRFAPVLVSACCTDPMTVQQAASLIGGEYELVDGDGTPTGKWQKVEGSLVFGEASLLFNTAASLNEGAQARLGKE